MHFSKYHLERQEKMATTQMDLATVFLMNYLNLNIKTWEESKVYPQTIVVIDLNNIKYDGINALEYIKILNCRSCVNDIILYPEQFSNRNDYIRRIKKKAGHKIIKLNSIKHMKKYYSFVLCPIPLIYLYVKLRIKGKKDDKSKAINKKNII